MKHNMKKVFLVTAFLILPVFTFAWEIDDRRPYKDIWGIATNTTTTFLKTQIEMGYLTTMTITIETEIFGAHLYEDHTRSNISTIGVTQTTLLSSTKTKGVIKLLSYL